MTTERHRHVERICQAALDRDAASRALFLADVCAGDEALRSEVEALLAHEHTAQPFMETPAIAVEAEHIAGRAGADPVRIGPYEVLSALGSGGMGQVYRARDPRLDREVAIKVLPARLLPDRASRARFEREARVLAALSHQHIAAIYGAEDTDRGPALILELVEGETLASRLKRAWRRGTRGLPVADAMAIARQIADALEAAHEKGIVHRDLKPANITITHDGIVKVLDFGIAQTLSDPRRSSPPIETLAADGAALILGTPAYMSPEQAQGGAVDKRTDIWAFGCVLYEMLTGERTFAAETASGTLARVIAREPDWSALPHDTPASVHQLLRRCLAKDRKLRLADIADARLDIDDARNQVPPAVPAGGVRPASGRWHRLAWGVTAVCLLALVLGAVYVGSVSKPQPPVRFDFAVRQSLNTLNTGIALSPDGHRLAFVAPGGSGEDVIWVRRLDALEALPLAGTENAYAPFWGPDSESIAFFAGGQLKRMSADGGPIQVLCEVTAPASSEPVASWNRRGDIVYAQTFGPLHRVSADGGVPTPISVIDGARQEFGHYSPIFLPDGERFLYWAGAGGQNSRLYASSLSSRERTPLATIAPSALTANGVLVFRERGLLTAQRLDLRRTQLVESSVPVVDGAAAVSVSHNGTLAYRAISRSRRELTWFDRDGRPLGAVGSPGDYEAPALSPDGTRVAVGRAGDIWLLDLVRGSEERLTTDAAAENYPVWSPDGRHILYMRGSGGALVRQPSGGAGKEEVLLPAGGVPYGWSADGRFVTYFSSSPTTFADLFVLPLVDGMKPIPFLQTRFQETDSKLSPNGKWMAYTSGESGRPEIFVQTFPPSEKRWAISTRGGTQPSWRSDGKELFYLGMDARLMSVEIDPAADFNPGVPRALFQTKAPLGFVRNSYAPAPDGQRFLVNVMLDDTESRIVVILNWPALTAG